MNAAAAYLIAVKRGYWCGKQTGVRRLFVHKYTGWLYCFHRGPTKRLSVRRLRVNLISSFLFLFHIYHLFSTRKRTNKKPHLNCFRLTIVKQLKFRPDEGVDEIRIIILVLDKYRKIIPIIVSIRCLQKIENRIYTKPNVYIMYVHISIRR